MSNIDSYLKYLNEGKESLNEIDPLFGAIMGASLLNMAYSAYKDHFSRAARACKNTVGRDKTLCLTKVKIEALKKQLTKLQQGLAKCGQARNEEKCRSKVQAKIDKVQQQIKANQEAYDATYRLAQAASARGMAS